MSSASTPWRYAEWRISTTVSYYVTRSDATEVAAGEFLALAEAKRVRDGVNQWPAELEQFATARSARTTRATVQPVVRGSASSMSGIVLLRESSKAVPTAAVSSGASQSPLVASSRA
jgi:hypothetical protein